MTLWRVVSLEVPMFRGLMILMKAFYANVGEGTNFLPGNCEIQYKLLKLNNGKLKDDCIKTTYQ